MTTARIGTVAWLAIYVGMVLIGLGLSLRSGNEQAGWAVASVGALGVVAGVVLVWVRSRIQDDPP